MSPIAVITAKIRRLGRKWWFWVGFVVMVMIGAWILWGTFQFAQQARAAKERLEADAAQAREFRVTGRAFLYSLCLGRNDSLRRQDEAWQQIAIPSLRDRRNDPEAHARLVSQLAQLRDAFRPDDCDAALGGLPEDEIEEVKQQAIRLPKGELPPSIVPPELLTPPG